MTIKDLKSQNLILFEVISGSRSFGLAIPTSYTDLKASNKDYDKILDKVDGLLASIEKSYTTSALPERPAERKATQALIRIREELYQ
jgi:predicted nucleotidyltransferase